MATMYYEKDCDLALLDGKTVAVVGLSINIILPTIRTIRMKKKGAICARRKSRRKLLLR